MRKRLLFVLCVAFFGAASFCAAAAPLPAQTNIAAADWKKFDALVADTKSAMMTDPEAALQKARSTTALAESLPQSPRQTDAVATGLWLEAEALTRVGKIAEARSALNHAIPLAENDGRITTLDGRIALALARVADNQGDVALALKSFHKAHDIFARLGEARNQSMALQGLGGIYDEAHDFARAISYYRRAAQVFSGDPSLELAVANNVGYAMLQLKRYDDAIANFNRALSLSATMDSPYLKGNVLSNLAAAYGRSHRFEEAQKAADEALRLFGPKDESGSAPFVWGIKAEIEFERGNLAAASADLDHAFKGVDIKTTIAPFRDMHEIAYKVYSASGNPALALAHLEAFKRLDDEGRSLAASANLALMGAQFDFATQRFEIEHLRSEQLKRDISLRESRAATQLVIFAALLAMAIIAALWFYRQNVSARRHRNEITSANVALTQTLAERDSEIVRRTEVEWQLRQAKDASEQANRAKSQFLANMSHELRTPLNAIMGFSEIISHEAFGAVGNKVYKNYANDIFTSGQHLLAILNDILDMARIDAGKIALVEEDIALAEVIDSALKVFSKNAREGKMIRFSGTDGLLRVRADERILRQIVINLVSNAVKFTVKDGLIDITVERSAKGIDIVVRDNGIGIPADKLSLVMEPFGQADDAFARSRGGIGLGLPIVKSLTELHGGRFTLESEEHVGTTARIHLPERRIIYARRGKASSPAA